MKCKIKKYKIYKIRSERGAAYSRVVKTYKEFQKKIQKKGENGALLL